MDLVQHFCCKQQSWETRRLVVVVRFRSLSPATARARCLQAPHAQLSTGGWLGLAGGLSRGPNADLGITSGARQGMKGDPRGPFTSASYRPVPHQRPAAHGFGVGKWRLVRPV